MSKSHKRLTVQAENWRWERRRVGEGEFDGIFSRSLEELCGLTALLLLAALLPLLLFPRQGLFRLFLLKINDGEWEEGFEKTRTVKKSRKSQGKGLTACLVDFPPAFRSLSFFSCFSYCFRSSFCFCTYIFLNVTRRHQAKIKYSKMIKCLSEDFICVAVQKRNSR